MNRHPTSCAFDYASIERAVFALSTWDGVWRWFFDQTGVEPVTVWYEDLVADRTATIERVLVELGFGPSSPSGVTGPTFRRQADGTSAAWKRRYDRLEVVRREATFAALAGVHAGETVYVCTGGADAPQAQVPRDAVTITVDGAAGPKPASFALLTRRPARAPEADVVVTVGRFPVSHSFVVPCLVPTTTAAHFARNTLAADASATPTELAAALAAHLGATRVEYA